MTFLKSLKKGARSFLKTAHKGLDVTDGALNFATKMIHKGQQEYRHIKHAAVKHSPLAGKVFDVLESSPIGSLTREGVGLLQSGIKLGHDGVEAGNVALDSAEGKIGQKNLEKFVYS